MPNLSINIPSKLKAEIDRHVASGKFSDASAYLSDLLRRDQRRWRQRLLEQRLLARLDRSNAVVMNDADFKHIRQGILKRVTSAGRR